MGVGRTGTGCHDGGCRSLARGRRTAQGGVVFERAAQAFADSDPRLVAEQLPRPLQVRGPVPRVVEGLRIEPGVPLDRQRLGQQPGLEGQFDQRLGQLQHRPRLRRTDVHGGRRCVRVVHEIAHGQQQAADGIGVVTEGAPLLARAAHSQGLPSENPLDELWHHSLPVWEVHPGAEAIEDSHHDAAARPVQHRVLFERFDLGVDPALDLRALEELAVVFVHGAIVEVRVQAVHVR